MELRCRRGKSIWSCCVYLMRHIDSLALVFVSVALLSTHLDTVCAFVLFDPKNITEYTIRIPALKKPTIFKRFTGSRKPSLNGTGENAISPKGTFGPSASSSRNFKPPFHTPTSGSSVSINPLSASVDKLPRGVAVAPGSFSFMPLPFTATKVQDPVPIFKYSGPLIWARDPNAFSKGEFITSKLPTHVSLMRPHRHHAHSKGFPQFDGNNMAPNKLPQLESQKNMRVVRLRLPYNGLDHGHVATENEKSYEASARHRPFDGSHHRRLIEYHKATEYEGSSPTSSLNPLDGAPEIQIINTPPRRGSEKHRFFGAHRHLADRPTIIRLTTGPMEKIQQPKFPLPLTIDNPSKQFIAEEKRLADGRNTYIISEVERGQSDIISKLRGPFNPTSMNANNIYNTEHHNGGPNHDWNLSLPAKKILTSPQLYDNKKNFNNFANIFSMESGATYDGNSNSIGYSGPNFGSDYGSVLELQNAKLRMQSSNNLHSNSINSNIQYSENNLNSYHQFNQNHSNNSNNSEYDSSHHNGNNKKFSQQKYKRPLVIAVGSVTKDSWGRQKDIPQWSGTRNGGRKTAIATSHERTNIQVLRTDKESKVVIPPGIIAILVPQNFGVSADTGTVTSSDAVDFDNGDQPIYESSSTTKKTVAASQAVVSDVLSNNGKVEPSKSPGPPYKVDFTQRLPPNAITAPEMFVPQIQNRMGSSTEATSSTSASKKVSIQKTSMPIVLTASTEKQLPRKNEQTYIPFPVNPSKNPELARRINNIHAQIQLSNSKNQRKTSTSARPAVNHWTSTATQRETTHLPLYQYPVKSSKTGHRQFQTRLSTPKSQISNRFLQDNQQYSTPVRRIASTTAMPVRYLQYQQYPQRTTLGYLNNHQVYTSPLVFSPAAFGSESAAIYLPRAATLKKPRNKILKNEFFNHYAVPDSTRSSQTFSFHGLLQSRSVTHPQQSILYREQQISRNDNRINLPFYINAC